MKKFLIISFCLFITCFLTYKIVPNLFPGIAKLDTYNANDIKDIYDAGFGERVTQIENALAENNAEGIQYMINDKKDLSQLMDDTETEDVASEDVEPEDSTAVEENIYSDINELTNITLNDITIIEVMDNSFDFSVNGLTYQMSGSGVIGNTDIYVKALDATNGTVTLQQGEQELLLTK